ncbi:ComEC family competence protein [Clostridium homopropionicum DSM 5847]|uniref:ComEC family competence protein n=1 Tax=Clostridium homopropionicum DSM 5847 TaxID=1121318 RepID=A0A0L6ZE46_9CLOT|nr:ComEC/Rec2 family competence protein [Clostridium homopropionicum]KOA21254.1 ComEC family competence protein [Clostridium homopropionicum DSM 5847]SFG28785.1 competence protein ComEC [Clostridium homopropionicum]
MERPLVYYFISTYIGALVLVVFQYNYLLCTLLVGIFLGVFYFNENKKKFIILVSFFILGSVSLSLYYNVNLGNKAEVRIIEKKRGYYLGEYKGRKLQVYINNNSLNSGSRVELEGKFNRQKDYLKGTIGQYIGENYAELNMDFIQRLYEFREKLYKKYNKILDEKKTAVIMAICFGDTRYLSYDQKNEYNSLGLSHIISVSGFHIAVVYKFLEMFLGTSTSIIMTFLYAIFTGAEAATIRAFIMIVILKGSKIVYRNYDSLSALCFAGLVLILVKPYYILDLGFNLSFLATLGIILFNKKLQKIFYKLPKKINDSVSITLSAQVFSMPYVMCTLNNVSLFFLPANLILLPIYSMIILLGNLGMILYKVDFLFNINSYLLYSILTSIDGATKLLKILSPNVVKYNFFHGIYMLIIFLTFIFIKRGYENLKYFPLIITYIIIVFKVL